MKGFPAMYIRVQPVILVTQPEKMIRKYQKIVFFVLLLLPLAGKGQDTLRIHEGKVSFVTSKNVYVKFDNTKGIQIGDTLSTVAGKKLNPALVVNRLSSTSAVCTPLTQKTFQKGERMGYYLKLVAEAKPAKVEKPKKDKYSLAGKNKKSKGLSQKKESMKARLSVASYSNIREQRTPSNKLVYRLSVAGNRLGESNFSVSSYVNYREIYDQRYEKAGRETKLLRVYNLSGTYAVDSSFSVTLGRKINYKASSLGVIDGVQGEKIIRKKFFVGGILGYRPDYKNYGINTDLLEYGTYFGHSSQGQKVYAQTTLGLLEQRFFGKLDRRYTYFQHSSNWNRKLNIFSSFEIDLFKNINGVKSSDFRLTNLFVSTRYRFSRRFSLGASYDSRQRVIYYETYKTDIEKLLADEARQGFRVRLNARPLKLLNVGLSIGKRFQASGQNESNNLNGFASYSKLPLVEGRLSVNYNYNQSNYLISNILGFRYSRSYFTGKLSHEVYYRMVHYNYLSSLLAPKYNYFGTAFRFRLSRVLSFSLLGEYVPDKLSDKYRVNARATYRFSRKGAR